MRYCKVPNRCCAKSAGGAATLKDLVTEYLNKYGKSYDKEDEWWGDKRLSWDKALSRAWLSRGIDRKMHPHQYRVAGHLQRGLEIALSDRRRPNHFKTFDELHVWIDSVTSRVKGLGPTTTYDVARRLGAWLGLQPQVVYLHAGTASGAAKLGVTDNPAPLDAFDPSIVMLGAMHAENFLCIYKNRLMSK